MKKLSYFFGIIICFIYLNAEELNNQKSDSNSETKTEENREVKKKDQKKEDPFNAKIKPLISPKEGLSNLTLFEEKVNERTANSEINILSKEEWKILTQDSVQTNNRSLVYPSLYMLTIYASTIGLAYVFYSPDELNWGYPSFDRFWTNISQLSYRWDPDEWIFNYLMHPLVGSETYIRARMQGFTVLESFMFAFASSTFWEYCGEGWFEPVSIQDMIVTPTIGSLLGEARFRAKLALKKNGSTTAAVFAYIIDPIQSTVDVFYRNLVLSPNERKKNKNAVSPIVFKIIVPAGNGKAMMF